MYQLRLDYSKPVIFLLPELGALEDFTVNFNIWGEFLDSTKELREISEIGDIKHYLPENEIRFIQFLYGIKKGQFNKSLCYSMTASACFTPILPAEEFSKTVTSIKVGDTIKLSELCNKLVELDYDNEIETAEACQFSQRGGIIDVFSPINQYPARIEFWGDEVDNIRLYSSKTQLTVEKVNSYTITGRDIIGGEEATSNLLEYFSEQPQVVVVYPERCRENLKMFSDEKMLENFEQMISKSGDNIFYILDPVEAADSKQSMVVSSIVRQLPIDPGGVLKDEIDFTNRILGVQARALQIKQWIDFDYRAYLVAENERGIDFVKEWLKENGIKLSHVEIFVGDFTAGFLIISEKVVVITEKELLCLPPKKKIASSQIRKKIDFDNVSDEKYTDFNHGDYVVHISHGIGIFNGIKEITTRNSVREVIEIEYADDMTLMVPVWQAGLVSRYVGSKKALPRLSKLGGTRWEKSKAEALRGAKEMAVELLQVQAVRSACDGYKFEKDDREQEFFEAAFPFNETIDQLKASEEVKVDMMSDKPMDRLVCGDVGYGKTEIAMRAAFKAVSNGKQVAVLVPTTILAQQHYYSFLERFAEFPVNIEMLSRFKTAAQQKETIERIKKGGVDIVIGTHRLIQKDIKFAELGLLVIDEEQRFGVVHKERLKKLRTTVDVLTMTATPIPRTLYLAMSGVRDFSTIMTAPIERLPVQTMVCQFNDEIIKNAIIREKRRGGQVFFLHNRVKSIETRYEQLKKMLPNVSFCIAHGQMNEHELEEIMSMFIQGKIDVLICTTIIESGVDIPNANTMIIERADRFGLAELYQLRGRVGRWTRQAYAYLLLPEYNVMTGKARERLSAIRRYTQLGVGFKLAVKDLEIRGAGNILGAKQSGHINSVGFELYCQLLKSAVSTLKGQKNANYVPNVDVSLSFLEFGHYTGKNKISAYLPAEYLPSEILRIDFYRRLSAALTVEKIHEIKDELIDRFGVLPLYAENFLKIMEIKLRVAVSGYSSISANNDHLFIEGSGRNIYTVNGKFPKLTAKDSKGKLEEVYSLVLKL